MKKKEIVKATRTGNFTASNIWKLLVNPRSKTASLSEMAKGYILEVLSEVLTGGKPEEIFSHALDWGKLQEPEAVKAFERATGVKGTYYGGSEPTFFRFKALPLGCSPDYLTPTEVVEFKCPWTSARHVEAIGADVEWLKAERKEYYAQIQLQMIVMGVDSGKFVSFDPRMLSDSLKLAIIDVPRDEDMHEKIFEKVAAAAEYMNEKIQKINKNF